MRSSSFLLLISAGLFLICPMGCKLDPAALTATNAVGGGTNTGTTGTSAATSNFFEVTATTTANVTIKASKNGDGVTPCRAVSGEDVLCVIDMDELDLYQNGYTISDNVPGSLCAYKGFLPYYYAIAPIGNQPTAVAYEADSDGKIIAMVANKPTGAGNTADIYYLINNVWYTHAHLYGAAAADAGAMRCPFDYTTAVSNGKNCCQGGYTLYTAADGKPSTTHPKWGGSAANCFAGPGMDAGISTSTEGLPRYTITQWEANTGVSTHFAVAAPVSKDFRNTAQQQIYAANYYEKADHGSNAPSPSLIANALRNGRLNYPPSVTSNTAHYTYDCLDPNREVVARIRVVAREWNMFAQLVSYLAGNGGNWDLASVSSNPLESGPVQSPSDPTVSHSHSPYNDFLDWKDIAGGAYGFDYTAFGIADLSSFTPTNVFPVDSSYYTGFVGPDN